MKKYKVKRSYPDWKITEVDVIRETEKCIFVAGWRDSGERRIDKSSSYECYLDTWESAHEFLLMLAQSRLDEARRNLQIAQASYVNVKGMERTQPSPTEMETNEQEGG